MSFRASKKGSGYLYQHDNQLPERVKTEGETKYLKCVVAKIVRDQFFVGVSVTRTCMITRKLLQLARSSRYDNGY